jgi:uncharacterized protein YegP (UPF0339 family)
MGKFEIYQSEKNQEFYFRLKAGNGENILGSQGYNNKASCENGVQSVMKNSGDESKYEVKEAKKRKISFQLKSWQWPDYRKLSNVQNRIRHEERNSIRYEKCCRSKNR